MLNVSPQTGVGRSIFAGKARRVAPLLEAGENQRTADQRFVLAGEVAADHNFVSPDWRNGSAAALWAFGLGYRRRIETALGADAVACLQWRRSGQVRGQNVDTFPVAADLRDPKIFDLLGILGRVQHPPAINAQLAVCQRDRCQFYAHAVKLSDESFNVKVRHFISPAQSCKNDFICRLSTDATRVGAARTADVAPLPTLPDLAADVPCEASASLISCDRATLRPVRE